MNPPEEPAILSFQNEIAQWEHAINSYNGPDPLENWYKYICWLELNLKSSPALEAKFRKAIEICLSAYDKIDNYKQDIRMVKLWIQYIDFQPNPLNLYKILYQQGIGTTCAAFYKGWAHYYNSSNLFKQAESIYNLGIQLKAQPIQELETAQKNFRFSVAQRMLYNDESSKKRTISSLREQRQQITTLSPQQNHSQHSKRIKLHNDSDKFNGGVENINDNQSPQDIQYSAPPHVYMYPSTSTDPSFAISTSLNYVYGSSDIYGATGEILEEEKKPNLTFESGFQKPESFITLSKNCDDKWNAPLYLEEPYDPNQRCFYPKHLVYPGNGQELSLEELKAHKWQFIKNEEKQKQEELRIHQENESLRQRQEQERLRQEQEAKRLIEEQERISREEALNFRLKQEKILQTQLEDTTQREVYQPQMTYPQTSQGWNCHNQSPASYGSYYQPSFENSPQYSYSHDHIYQSHYAQQHGIFHHSPQHYQNSPNYQSSQNFPQTNQQQSVIVNRNQYESQQLQPEAYYESPHYPSTGYQEYHQPHSQTPLITRVMNSSVSASPKFHNKFLSPDYQDVEYLIDHQGEIDPQMFQQPIIEPIKGSKKSNIEEDGENGSDSGDSDEEYRGPAPVVNSYMLDDLEDQIQATTIKFSSNGKSRDKKITIKFRKEKEPSTILNSESNSESSMPLAAHSRYTIPPSKTSLEPSSTSSSSSGKKKSRKQKFQNEILNTFDGDSTQFMPSATSSCSSTANGEYSSTFGNNTFNGCVTANRKNTGKSSTPVNTCKLSKKSELQLLSQNDDSVCSYNGDQNSFFQAENDEDFKGRRMERALVVIEEQLKKRDIDPFDSELCKAFLVKLNFPNRENISDYKITNVNLPKLGKNQVVPFNGINYQIEKEVGRGSYGSVYRGINTHNGSVVALKYQKPPNSWELYICTEVKKRLKNTDILPGFMQVSAAVVAPNASVLISEFSPYGSLLDINNRIRQATTKVMNESLVMHFTSQILSIVSHLHNCNIIHADIKPDNFLLMTLPSTETYVPSLRLIDFGCAVDMNMFSEGTEFKKIIQTDGFTCIEMQEGRSWSFQTDLFCVAGTIHVMLLGEYMQINKKFGGVWDIKQKLPRYLNKAVWNEVFSKLLNIKDKHHMPNLHMMQNLIKSEINENELMKHIRTCSNLIRKR